MQGKRKTIREKREFGIITNYCTTLSTGNSSLFKVQVTDKSFKADYCSRKETVPYPPSPLKYEQSRETERPAAWGGGGGDSGFQVTGRCR